MLTHSKQPGKHTKLYTQFATIRKQQTAFSNLFMASTQVHGASILINTGSQSNGILTSCDTNSQWFKLWSLACETRMGFILKQNQAILISILKELINEFKNSITLHGYTSQEGWYATMGYAYTIITFFATLRGSEGLKVDAFPLLKHWERGNFSKPIKYKGTNLPPHIIVPIQGRFKGEQGERCHLLALSNSTKSGIHIRNALNAALKIRALNKFRVSGYSQTFWVTNCHSNK